MFDKDLDGFCSEFYVVERTIEVVVEVGGEARRIRIEALRHEHEPRVVYSTQALVLEHITVQPTYPQSEGSYDRLPERMRVWVDYDLPYTRADSAEGVLRRGLSFLCEQCAGQ